MNRVWKQSQQKGSALLLLLAIADNANDEGICWPGMQYLAEKTRLSKRQVQRLILDLDGTDELAIEYGAGRSHTHLFHVLTGLPLIQVETIKEAVMQSNASRTLLKDDKLSPPLNRIKGDRNYRKGDIHGKKGDDFYIKGDTAMSPEPFNHQLTYLNPGRDHVDLKDPFYAYEAYKDQARLSSQKGTYDSIWRDTVLLDFDRSEKKIVIATPTVHSSEKIKMLKNIILRLMFSSMELRDSPDEYRLETKIMLGAGKVY